MKILKKVINYWKRDVCRSFLVLMVLFLIFLLSLFVPPFSEIIHSILVYPLLHGSSYGKGFIILFAMLLISLLIFVKNLIVKDKKIIKNNISGLKKKIVFLSILFFFFITAITCIGFFIELKINATYLDDRNDLGYSSLQEYVPSLRVYNPSTHILYGTTSTFHSHSLKGMFYVFLPDKIKQDFLYDMGSTISILFDNNYLIAPFFLFILAAFLILFVALLIHKLYNSISMSLLWAFVSTSLICVSIDGGILSDSYRYVLSLFFVFIFLFFFVRNLRFSHFFISLAFFPLLTFLRDSLVQISYVFSSSQIMATTVRGYEQSAYYIFFVLILLIFIYSYKKIGLIGWQGISSQTGRETTLTQSLNGKYLVVVLVLIMIFNIITIMPVESIGVNKVAVILPYEFNDNINDVDVSLIYQDQGAYIYTMESERDLRRSDFFEMKKSLDGLSTRNILKTIEFCNRDKKRRLIREIFNSPELEVGQVLGPIEIVDLAQLNNNITRITYECDCSACHFVYNLALREFSDDEKIISLSFKKKSGLNDMGYYLKLFVPFNLEQDQKPFP